MESGNDLIEPDIYVYFCPWGDQTSGAIFMTKQNRLVILAHAQETAY